MTTMALMTQVIPEVSLPVVAAGGFADGRGLAAALVMGAAGVQIGTRFLVAEECTVHANMKAKLLEAGDADSIVTGQSLGHAVRGLKINFRKILWRWKNSMHQKRNSSNWQREAISWQLLTAMLKMG